MSLGLDGKIAKTMKDGSTTLLATNVSQRAESSFSSTLGVLAYICDAGSLCLLDVRTARPIAVRKEHRGTTVSSVDFSPDGRELATITDNGELRVFAVQSASGPTELLHLRRTGGSAVKFVDQRNVAVGTPTGMLVVTIGGKTRAFTDPDAVLWEPSAPDHLFALTTTRGEAYLVDPETLKATDRIKLCHELAVSIKIIPGTGTIAFACQEGTIGLWSLASHHTRSLTQVEGRASKVSVSESGKLIFATGDTGTVTMYDLETALTTSFRGHAYRVAIVSPPTVDFPYAISGDARGALRTWRISGTPQWRQLRALDDFGSGPKGAPLTLGIRRVTVETSVSVPRVSGARQVEIARHPPVELQQDGIYYVDLSRVEMTDLEPIMARLAHAPGVVFDARSTLHFVHDVLGHLVSETIDISQGLSIPHIIRPDHLQNSFSGQYTTRAPVGPTAPRFEGRIAFLVGAGTISYGETVMAQVERYHLGAIIGGATGGTNGNMAEITTPGGCRVTFTATLAKKPEGRTLHLTGIHPTIPVARTLAGVRAAQDEVLERGLSYVRTGS